MNLCNKFFFWKKNNVLENTIYKLTKAVLMGTF